MTIIDFRVLFLFINNDADRVSICLIYYPNVFDLGSLELIPTRFFIKLLSFISHESLFKGAICGTQQ